MLLPIELNSKSLPVTCITGLWQFVYLRTFIVDREQVFCTEEFTAVVGHSPRVPSLLTALLSFPLHTMLSQSVIF
jgi:hypothetical protein